MSEYELKRDGVDAQVKAAKDTAEAIRTLSGSNTAESIVVTGEEGFTTENQSAGTRVRLANAALTFWHDVVNFPAQFGRLAMAAGERSFFLYPPYAAGHRHANSLIISGRDEDAPGNAQLASDGYVRLQVKDEDGASTGYISLDAERILLYGLGTVSSSPNLVLDFPDGFPVLKLSTSSRRYKQDIDDAGLDGEDVRQWEIHTWRDKAAVAEVGDAAPVHVGHIAEQIADVSPDCVDLDAEGRPNALRPNPMSAHVVALVQRMADDLDEHAELIAAQDARLAARDVVIADLTARLEALEAK